MEGFVASDEMGETAEMAYGSDEHDMTWDQGSDIVLAIPKIEPIDDDDDLRMDDIKEAPLTPVPETDRDPLAAVSRAAAATAAAAATTATTAAAAATTAEAAAAHA